ncbi:Na+/H+ antiporter subunit D [Paenibacillus senegalensis]|uniref:Na+/H+ antiporter subunit D n=1 Tax=Paenibacillus senegalensis TaxID=1465766 RepID=UPI000288EA17|nr:Na+/H+ antiporter subunit D [Paenibacillus senegalensis]
MSNLVVLPMLIPLLTGIIIIFFYRTPSIQRIIAGAGALLNIAVSAYLVQRVYNEGILTLNFGGWMPPFGISFVADMFSALLVLTTSLVSTACLFYAFKSIGEEKERHHFYVFFQFVVVGVVGSFLTGDIFNLFVCFEVMLIASYGMIVLGGTKLQLRESLKYILVNVVSSALFVGAVAYLYAIVGTLNFAHISQRVAEVGQPGILTVSSLVFLVIFSVKAGLFLFFWLPGSYKAPPAVVTALFGALLTKVGIYAIIRIYTIIFYHDQAFTHTIIGWMAAATIVLGALGAVAYRDVPRILIYNIVIAVGFIMIGLVVANQQALEGAIFYLIHDMIVKALLFLLGGMMITVAGTPRLAEMGGIIKRYPALGWMFFIAAMALVGVPPLSGFVGKLLIVQGGFSGGWYWLTAIGLASSLLILYSMMKIFMNGFWGEEKYAAEDAEPVSLKGMLAPAACLLTISILMGVGAEWVYPYISQAGEVLLNPQLYIDAVLKE